MTFGERITQLRKENGYPTRKSFCEKLGIPETTLRNYETDAREPGHTFLIKVSSLLNVSTDYILGIQKEKEMIYSYKLKSSEYEHVQKYRDLDDFGRESVDLVLNRESQRVKEARAQKEHIKTLETELSSELIPYRIITYCQRLASAGSGEYLFDDIPTDVIKAEDSPESRKADFVIGVNGDSMEPDYYDGEKVFVEKTPDIEIGEVGVFVRGDECFIKECGKNGLISRNKDYPDVEPFSDGIKVVGRVIGKVKEIA